MDPASGGGGAGADPIDTFCEKRCACQNDTSDACTEGCAEETAQFIEAAGAQGCEDEAQASVDCSSKNYVCEEGDPPPVHGCWQEERAYAECVGLPVPVGQGPEGGTGGAGGSGGGSAPDTGLPSEPPGLPPISPPVEPPGGGEDAGVPLP